MAMRDIELIQKEASKLSPEEKVLLAQRLLDEAREAKAGYTGILSHDLTPGRTRTRPSTEPCN